MKRKTLCIGGMGIAAAINHTTYTAANVLINTIAI